MFPYCKYSVAIYCTMVTSKHPSTQGSVRNSIQNILNDTCKALLVNRLKFCFLDCSLTNVVHLIHYIS